MFLLLTMTLAGSIPFLCYLFLFHTIGDRIPMKFYILLLRMSIIFYLCPFQVTKYLLPLKLIELFHGVEMTYQKTIDVLNYADSQEVIGKNYLIYPAYIPLIYVICLLCFSICAITIWYQYFKSYRGLLLSSDILDDDLTDFIDSHPQFSSLNKKSFCTFEQEYANTPFTTGFFAPCIVFPKWNLSEKQREFVYSHELTHILHHDTLWKALCTMAFLLHWYNPLVYLLLLEHTNACEYYTDEYCTSFMSKKDKKEYISLIVHLTNFSCNMQYGVPNFSNSFIGGKESMKKRIDFIFKQRKPSKLRQILAVLCICLVFFTSSISVFAYTPATNDTVPLENSSTDEEVTISWSTDTTNSSLFESTLDFSKSSSYFVDETGKVTPILDEADAEPNALCFHAYVPGYRESHRKNTKTGSCEVKRYSAQICYKCGSCITGELMYTVNYPKCPH